MNRRTLLAGGIAAAATALLASRRPAQAAPLAFTRGTWPQLLKAHAGHKTVVHFWGLTCGPCLAELPDWGRLHQANPNFTLVLVAADSIPQLPDALARTLA